MLTCSSCEPGRTVGVPGSVLFMNICLYVFYFHFYILVLLFVQSSGVCIRFSGVATLSKEHKDNENRSIHVVN